MFTKMASCYYCPRTATACAFEEDAHFVACCDNCGAPVVVWTDPESFIETALRGVRFEHQERIDDLQQGYAGAMAELFARLDETRDIGGWRASVDRMTGRLYASMKDIYDELGNQEAKLAAITRLPLKAEREPFLAVHLPFVPATKDEYDAARALNDSRMQLAFGRSGVCEYDGPELLAMSEEMGGISILERASGAVLEAGRESRCVRGAVDECELVAVSALFAKQGFESSYERFYVAFGFSDADRTFAAWNYSRPQLLTVTMPAFEEGASIIGSELCFSAVDDRLFAALKLEDRPDVHFSIPASVFY